MEAYHLRRLEVKCGSFSNNILPNSQNSKLSPLLPSPPSCLIYPDFKPFKHLRLVRNFNILLLVRRTLPGLLFYRIFQCIPLCLPTPAHSGSTLTGGCLVLISERNLFFFLNVFLKHKDSVFLKLFFMTWENLR